MEPNEDDKPKHDPIQPKLEPKYEKYVGSPKPKRHFLPNLAQAYKVCIRWVFNAYAPNLWRMYSLDRKPKITQFPFDEILGQPT